MDMSVAISAMINFIGFFLVAYLVFVVWPRLVVDYERQKLFELRDNLFDLAASGMFSFESESYVNIRALLNSMIRGAEFATLWNYTKYASALEKYDMPDVNEFILTMSGENSPGEIREAYETALNSRLLLIFIRNPFLTVVGVIGICVLELERVFCSSSERVIDYMKRRNENAVKADACKDLFALRG